MMSIVADYVSLLDYFGHQIALEMDNIILFDEQDVNPSRRYKQIDFASWISCYLDYSGCLDSPAEHQWHCDPEHCTDWNPDHRMLEQDEIGFDMPLSEQEQIYCEERYMRGWDKAVQQEKQKALRQIAATGLFTVAPIDDAGRLGFPR